MRRRWKLVDNWPLVFAGRYYWPPTDHWVDSAIGGHSCSTKQDSLDELRPRCKIVSSLAAKILSDVCAPFVSMPVPLSASTPLRVCAYLNLLHLCLPAAAFTGVRTSISVYNAERLRNFYFCFSLNATLVRRNIVCMAFWQWRICS